MFSHGGGGGGAAAAAERLSEGKDFARFARHTHTERETDRERES